MAGAYALAAHGYPRATLDIDVWIMPSPDNAGAVLRALKRFGAPLGNLTSTDSHRDEIVFQIGVAPRRIDIITGASGLKFAEAFARSTEVDIEGISVPVLCVDDIILNKRTTGRTKDLADAEALESLRKQGFFKQ